MTSDQWTGTYEAIPLGATESFTRTVDAAAIDAFAGAIQSFHPIHTDRDWVRANTSYPDRLAHGVMTTALMSRPIANFCDRWRIKTALVSTASKYVRPVIAGDTVTTVIRLVEKLDARKRMRFEVEARNQDGAVVMVGEAVEQAI